jgi:hypothetical protein
VPPFPKPKFDYSYDPAKEVSALRRYRDTEPGRAIPAKSDNRLLLATWNIANLGVQDRLDQERQAFLYDRTKVSQLEEVGRLSIPPSQTKQIKLPGTTITFPGFDRGPYLGSFQSANFQFLLVNVHLFFGSDKAANIERRILETYAVAWWANKRRNDQSSYVTDTIPLGDFNSAKQSRATRSTTPSPTAGSRFPITPHRSAPRSPPTTTTTKSRSSQAARRTASPGK